MWLHIELEKLCLTVNQAAGECEVSNSSIGDYIKGTRLPGLENFYMICRNLGLNYFDGFAEILKDMQDASWLNGGFKD